MILSKKVHQVLKSKTNLSDKELSDMSDSDGWAIIYGNAKKKDVRPQICFTGFSPNEREELESFAASKDFKVVKSVTKNLNYLCCGDNAGPSKKEKTKKQGALIINKDELINSFANDITEEGKALKVASPLCFTEKSRKLKTLFGKEYLKIVFEVSNLSNKSIEKIEGSMVLLLDGKEIVELTICQKYQLKSGQERPISIRVPFKSLPEKQKLEILKNYKQITIKWKPWKEI
jgi:hypothetical protein